MRFHQLVEVDPLDLAELGKEALLWGQRVVPKKLTSTGFDFFYEGVEDSMRFQLGRDRG